MAVGISKRDYQEPTETIYTPHGTEVLVPKRRAEALLSRPPLDLPGGIRRKYGRTIAETNVNPAAKAATK